MPNSFIDVLQSKENFSRCIYVKMDKSIMIKCKCKGQRITDTFEKQFSYSFYHITRSIVYSK